DLHGHLLADDGVLAAVHHPHAPLAEDLLDLVAPIDGAADVWVDGALLAARQAATPRRPLVPFARAGAGDRHAPQAGALGHGGLAATVARGAAGADRTLRLVGWFRHVGSLESRS